MFEPPIAQIDLAQIFEEVNRKHFDGFLEPPRLLYNSRLRSSAGRFRPGSRSWPFEKPAEIEVASYLLKRADARHLVTDTLGHEMIHYWLWVRRKPYGHTSEFLAKMRQMGVSRYNTAAPHRPIKYIYLCVHCERTFPARRRLDGLACSDCCKRWAGGRYARRFGLVLLKWFDPKKGEMLWYEGEPGGAA